MDNRALKDDNGNNVSWKELDRLFDEKAKALNLSHETITELRNRISAVESRQGWLIAISCLAIALFGFVGFVAGQFLK